ncbi:putative MFS family arabinose efflux permease [Actinokineospora baliensis]|uniref:MFS transporter n=1 Tax=Actinokineospora baliensis TaxID=547056 RepID=UPI001957406F|nr:MFS transporter [Actinokineospora baliensis]MBM7775016.1 putative MFS family arabinose efflux permease [Actinokineospora baliensis]
MVDTAEEQRGRVRVSLPVFGLLAFTLSGFIAIMTETIPAGLLPQISAGLGVSEGLAGQLLTLYAIGSVVAAVPVIAATRGWNRRPLLLLAIAALLVFNAITALSGDYVVTLAARFVAGMAAGVVWGLLAGYARRMVAPEVQGKAVAIVGVGQPIALSLGVPLGAWLGTLAEWRGVFWIMSAIALVLLLWIVAAVPDFPGQGKSERMPIGAVLRTPGIRSILWVILLWILAHNILYTYIAPFVAEHGLGDQVPLMLLLFGAAAVVGIWFAGALVDGHLRQVTLLSLLGFAVAAAALAVGTQATPLIYAGVLLWGLTFGGAPTLLQTAIADSAGDSADVAQSMLVTVFNLAVAGGGAIGGVLLEWFGPDSFPWSQLVLAVAALAVVWSAKAHGFRSGRRVA